MNRKFAYFAGGCFWCMVNPFDVFKGVLSVKSGYMGGALDDPTYEDVKSQSSGHYEVIEIEYQADIISYDKLLEAFWRQVDPTDDSGQFQDRGSSYRTGIFYTDDEQLQLAKASKKRLEESARFDKPLVTPIVKAGKFYLAEEGHQDYYKTNPKDYKLDRSKSGRDEFIMKYWGDDYFTIYDDLED